MSSDRDAWTAYAEREGLIRSDSAAGIRRNPKPGDGQAVRPEHRSRGNKYGARRVQVDGIWFDSVKESARYQVLKLLRETGQIGELEIQPIFPLHVMELYRTQGPIRITTVGVYKADFRYCDLRTGEIVIEDVKSEFTKTEAYRLRKRIAELVHGIAVREL